jgi:3-hydroxybutyryl-CoA dehydratase
MPLDQWTPGYELPRLVRTMTAERMRWFADALETVSTSSDHPLLAPANIHTDDDFARANGFSARVADGMVSTNWIQSLLGHTYGVNFLAGGTLRTRYVRPIFEDERIEVIIRVAEREHDGDGDRLVLDVQCVKDDGQVATSGTATVRVPDAGRALRSGGGG